MFTLPKLSALTVTAALVTASPAAAQCFLPDNLTGPCWEPTELLLPDLPGWELEGSGICYNQCAATSKQQTLLVYDPPVPNGCGQFLSSMKVVDMASGFTVMSGVVTLDYTRTWHEANSATGDDYQVWRFIAKVDLERTSQIPPNACYIPASIGPNSPYNEAFWYGYLDWAQNCQTGQFSNVSVLFNNCDDFISHPALSDHPALPGGFNPGSYRALVAPDNPIQSFDPTVIASPRSGPLFAEAVRNVNNAFAPGFCTYEEELAGGTHQLLGTACMCPLALAPAAQSAVHIDGIGTCPDATGVPSTFSSLQVWNPAIGFKWFEMIETSLGTWTDPSIYPGRESVMPTEGFVVYHDSCAAVVGGTPADTLDFMYGAKTSNGFQVIPNPDLPGANTQNFLDLASNYSEAGVFLPMMGSVRPTDHLIYVNM